MKKALITGITGQDGSYLAEFLLEKGYEVFGLYRRGSTDGIFDRIQHLAGKVKLICADLTDLNSLEKAFEIAMPDEVYNLASQSHVGVSFLQPSYTQEVNWLGVERIIFCMNKYVPKSKLYQASTSELFGEVSEIPQSEKTPFNPVSPYANAKLNAHKAIEKARAEGLFACAGILFNHECFYPTTPLIINHKGIIKIAMIKEIRKSRDKASKEFWDLNNEDYSVWDGKSWTKIKCISSFKVKENNKQHSCKIYNTRNGIINVTNNHNLYSNKNVKKTANSFKIGDKLLHQKFPPSNEVSVISLDEAEFMGMMVADGWCSEQGKGNFSKMEEKIHKRLIELWSKVSLGSATIKTNNKKLENKAYGISTQINLNGNSDYLKYLHKQIYTKYEKYKKVPEIILNANKSVKLSFLKGYNNCDGLKENLCTYEFKSFKTNSPVLALGLIYLMNCVSKQEYNLNFEEDGKYFGYYSINFLTDKMDSFKKKEIVQNLLDKKMSQREIARRTKISRVFIRKVVNNEKIGKHPLLKDKEALKKIVDCKGKLKDLYNIETESGKLMAGVGNLVVGNSPRRGIEFVTRKFTDGIARIKLGLPQRGTGKNYLELGNLEAKRDWGYAGDYVEAMWLMLQQDEPKDYVIATGETRTIREFVETAVAIIGVKITWKGKGMEERGYDQDGKEIIRVNEEYFRPSEVRLLLGDASKARKELRWKPKVNFKKLVKLMVESDLENLK